MLSGGPKTEFPNPMQVVRAFLIALHRKGLMPCEDETTQATINYKCVKSIRYASAHHPFLLSLWLICGSVGVQLGNIWQHNHVLVLGYCDGQDRRKQKSCVVRCCWSSGS